MVCYKKILLLFGLICTLIFIVANYAPHPPEFRYGKIAVDSKSALDGYTLLALYQKEKGTIYLIDGPGTVAKKWETGLVQIQQVILLDTGHLMVVTRLNGLVELSWEGKVIHQLPSKYRGYVHHELFKQPNGNVLTLFRRSGKEERVIPDKGAFFDFIAELSVDLKSALWIWKPEDHLEEFAKLAGLSFPLADYKLDGGLPDWLHLNAVIALPDTPLGKQDSRFKEGNILFSSRHLNLIGIIDRETEQLVWTWGRHTLDGQHSPRMLANGNIILFDNGSERGYSRIVELNPLSGETLWTYELARDKKSFYGKIRSSVQRLPNGNTFITVSTGRLFEVTPEGRVVLDYLIRGPKGEKKSVTIHKARRYPKEFVSRFF